VDDGLAFTLRLGRKLINGAAGGLRSADVASFRVGRDVPNDASRQRLDTQNPNGRPTAGKTMKVSSRASSPIRYVVSRRLQSADS
jgi:hypothetical protein